MRITPNYGPRSIRRSALALAAALVFAATGSARAISPTVEAPIKWKGGVEIMLSNDWGFGIRIYTVPAGSNFMLTDLIIANNSSTQIAQFRVFNGSGATCTLPTYRTAYINIPPNDTVVVSLATGIGFAAGTWVCIGATQPIELTGRGFLFGAAPAN